MRRAIHLPRLPAATLVALTSFMGLGLADATLGTAWPSIHRTLSVPLGDLGLVQLAGTAGFLSSSAISGRLAARLGRTRSLAGATGLAAASLGLLGSAPVFAVLIVAALLVGFAGGFIEPSVQSHIALSARTRTMNLLHGFYGIGATIGPVIVSALLVARASWRLAYLILLSVDLIVMIGIIAQRRAFNATTPPRVVRAHPQLQGTGLAQHEPFPRPALTMALVLFFVYTGLEMGTGQWAFSLLTAGRHLGAGSAGLLVGGFWAALTAGRLATAAIGDRISTEAILTASACGALAGEALLWWNPTHTVGALGLLLTGASLAPAFPLMMSRTSRWAATARVSTAIGWQSASASVGIAALSGFAGLLVGSFGITVLCPFLTSLAAAFVVLQFAALRIQDSGQVGMVGVGPTLRRSRLRSPSR